MAEIKIVVKDGMRAGSILQRIGGEGNPLRV